jgi:hypothetical protein
MRTIGIGLALALLCLAAQADEASVRELERKCEVAREARLKPLRDAEIAKCRADGRDNDGYCERYYRDFGNAVRLANGATRPRLFDDLPECVAAYKARREFNINPD